jgi:hypothetical protein
MIGSFFSLLLSSLLAIFWPASTPDGIVTEGLKNDMGVFVFVWLFCIIIWFLQDILKVLTFKWMYKVNFNNITKSGAVELPESAKKLRADLDEAIADSTHGGH